MTLSMKPRSDTRQPPLKTARATGVLRSFCPPYWGRSTPEEIKPVTAWPGSPLETFQAHLRPSLGERLRQRWATFFKVWDWLENSWVGDVIGLVCLYATGYVLIIMAWAFS